MGNPGERAIRQGSPRRKKTRIDFLKRGVLPESGCRNNQRGSEESELGERGNYVKRGHER